MMYLAWAFFVLAAVVSFFFLSWMGRTTGIRVMYRMEATGLVDGGESRSVTEFESYITTPEAAFALGRKIEVLHSAMHEGMESLHPK